ncbi:carboxypeptidase-like regulatory domain-containing protein [Roseiflexus sp.]|uniref:carboxypeptidase-like regulatory domain-containing protein n=1 Tax=Roseiflexus sp. TaxID=2562120 RepID=UPI00398B5D32
MSTISRISAMLLLVGVWITVWSMSVLVGVARSVQAQELPPRPTLTPVVISEEPQRVPRPGRIVGTVIDLTSGAPASGLIVRINNEELITDANGNYGRDNLAPGTYAVELIVPLERGVPAQSVITIILPEGETARQDLAFRRLPAATSTIDPSGAEMPTSPPAALPSTGALDDMASRALIIGMVMAAGGLLLRRTSRRMHD